MLVIAVASWCVPVAAQAAFPGTNGKLAFVSARNGFPADNDLYTMNADGTSQTRITSLDQDELYPSWTRSGAKIVFQHDPGLHPEIRVANADGSGLQQLTSNSVNDMHPAWSPYGTKIVFASDRDATSGVPDLFVMNADGSGQTNITNTPAIAEDYPAWSPGGSKLAFSRDGDIYTANPDGSSATPLTQTPETDVEPDWSPNGGQIAYHTGLGSNDEIWKMNADGSGKANLTNNGATVDERPVWSPAGDKIAFTRGAFNSAEVYVMNADGSGQTRITNNTVMDGQPAWQPVGSASTVTVLLDSQPDDPQDVGFRASGLDDGFTFGPPTFGPTLFALDEDADPVLSNQKVFTSVTPGPAHSVTQDAVAGWDATATCSDGSSSAAIDVSAGENVTCTFTHRKRGQIVVVKDAQPNDPQDFDFVTGGGLTPATFQLDDDSDAALSNTRAFTSVPAAGGYSISESAPPSWTPSTATCSDGSPVTNINVAAGEIVTCTFTSQKRGSITVVKDATPDDAQDFSFTAGGGLSPTSFQLDDDSNATLSNTRTFANVTPGAGYSVAETVPSGWDQTAATCDDGSPVTNVNLSAGENVTCTFSNRKRAQIIVVKDATPDDAQDFSFTAGGGLSPASFSLDDDSDATLSNTRTFSNVVPGSGYSVSETVPAGWDQTSATCNDGSPVTNVNLAAGETVTCTFSNRKRGQIVVTTDAIPNDPQDFSFTAGGGLSPASFSLDDDSDATLSNTRTFANVVPGSGYSVAETVPSGWDQTSATCNDGSPVSNVNLAAGEIVTCTFTNRKRGRIVVIKNATPDDPQDFGFTAGGGLTPASFQLDDDADGTLSNSRTFNDVVSAAGYSLAEAVPAGWDQASTTCDDGSPVANIDVAPGETVTCTFTNVKRGQIIVVEDALPNDPQDFSFTAGGGLSPTSFSLDDDADAALSNTQTFTSVPVGGGYSLAQSMPAGWDLSTATCSDGSPVTNINVAAGEIVTCTFTSQKRGSITVVKDATPDDAQDFSFTAGGGLSPTSFQLDDDSNATLSNTRTFANVTPGAGYSVAETVPSGWDQTAATCDDGSPVTNVNLSAGENVTCTFSNRKRAQIIVVKDATPDDAQDFSFTAGGGLSPASFSLDDDSDATLSNTRTFSNVVPGSGYSVSETVPAGWDQTSATCNDGSPVTNVNLAAGETVTCTFSNRKRGQIVVTTDAIPNDPQDFSFTAGGGLSPASFSLDDDSDATLSNTRTFANVVPGSGYSVAETVPSGWDQTSATCNDGSPVSNVNLAAGEIVTCTFTNRKRARLTVVNDAVPDDPQDFSFAAGGGLSPASFSLDDDSDDTLSNTRTFVDVVPGSGFSVSEAVPSGWDQASATCDDASPVSNVSLSAGEHVTCTFTNQRRGNIVVVKNATPDDPQDFGFTAGGGLTPASFQLDDDADGTLSNTRSFTNLVPAAGYSLSETVPGGWDQTAATCDDGSPVSNVNVGPGETVTCTFDNRRRGQVILVEDAVPNDAQDFSFTAGGGLSPTSVQLDDDSDGTLSNTRTFADVVPGSGYSLSQSAPAGWDPASVTCDDGSPASNIAVAPGETVTCTFTHRKQGSITVIKQAQPSDPQDFSFTAGGGLSPTSFSLDDDSDATLPAARTFGAVSPRSGYSVSEGATPGWDLLSATCDDGSPVSNIDVAAGEAVTCTFSSRKLGRIVVVKDAQPDDPQDFSFVAGGGLSPTSFSLDDDSDATLSNTRAFNDLTPVAGYSVSETLPVGWVLISATCSDGSPVSNVDVATGETVTCTFVSQRGYPRPRGATPLTTPLVPAFGECTAPNRVHGPSLASPSCNPPSLSSPHLTVGTPDANGQAARMVGNIKFKALVGDPSVPADEADVSIRANITDVRLRSNTNDYVGELEGAVVLRITDRLNGAGLNEAATVSDVPFAFTIPCTGTSGTENSGSTCAVITSADAVLPGAVTEAKRSIWQMGDVRVSDGGPDGQASTAGNSPFLRQGIFIP